MEHSVAHREPAGKTFEDQQHLKNLAQRQQNDGNTRHHVWCDQENKSLANAVVLYHSDQ